jgi:Spy/CpxP family protein refolding chaperone
MHAGSIAIVVALGLAGSAAAAAADDKSLYAGQQSRSIKALADEEIAALRGGEGMGLAKAAELNGYPGPRHVLDLAAALNLTGDQVRQVSAIRERMSAAARTLGTALVERERALDRLFAESTITPPRLARETTAIAEVQGRLRAVHLAAHIETRAVLTPAQVASYNGLRGYGPPATSADDRSGTAAHHRHP